MAFVAASGLPAEKAEVDGAAQCICADIPCQAKLSLELFCSEGIDAFLIQAQKNCAEALLFFRSLRRRHFVQTADQVGRDRFAISHRDGFGTGSQEVLCLLATNKSVQSPLFRKADIDYQPMLKHVVAGIPGFDRAQAGVVHPFIAGKSVDPLILQIMNGRHYGLDK